MCVSSSGIWGGFRELARSGIAGGYGGCSHLVWLQGRLAVLVATGGHVPEMATGGIVSLVATGGLEL